MGYKMPRITEEEGLDIYHRKEAGERAQGILDVSKGFKPLLGIDQADAF